MDVVPFTDTSSGRLKSVLLKISYALNHRAYNISGSAALWDKQKTLTFFLKNHVF